MTTIEIVTGLASTVLIKGSVVLAVALLLARLTARTASNASFIFSIGFTALVLLPLLSGLLPELALGSLTLNHGVTGRLPGVPFSLLTLLLAGWATGAGLMLVRFGLDLRAARALTSRARSLTNTRTMECLRRAVRSVGSRTPIVRETDELHTVALIGHRNPVLLVPVDAHGWSDEELFGVFCHELEHLRRGDWLLSMAERVIAAVYWVNPLAHVAVRSAHGAREHAADDAALRGGAGPQAYANRLIMVAREIKAAPRLAGTVAFAGGGRVDGRVRALFEGHRDRGGVSAVTSARAIVLALPLLLALAAVQPWTCIPTGEQTTTSGCP